MSEYRYTSCELTASITMAILPSLDSARGDWYIAPGGGGDSRGSVSPIMIRISPLGNSHMPPTVGPRPATLLFDTTSWGSSPGQDDQRCAHDAAPTGPSIRLDASPGELHVTPPSVDRKSPRTPIHGHTDSSMR